MTKTDYVKMLYDRAEYLRSEVADFENCNGGAEYARLMAIKEQVSCIFGLINAADKELFPTVIRCEQTNEEWLHSLNTEQLAVELGNIVNNAYFCAINGKTNTCYNRTNCTGYCQYGWKKWLKAVHKE